MLEKTRLGLEHRAGHAHPGNERVARRRLTVRPNPAASDARPASPRTGRGLAVLGSFFGAAPEVAAAGWDGGVAGAEGAGVAPAAGVPGPAPLLASVACTSFSVRTRGGFVVMMVAVSWSLARKSEICAGLPSRMILTPRLSMSLCVNIFTPSAVRTMMLVPTVCITVPFFTSVTVTGTTVVFVVMVAVPAMPGFSSCTDSIFPSMLNRKSSGTVSSLVPSGNLTTSWLPSTEMTWNFLVSVVVDVCAKVTAAVRQTSAPHNTTRTIARVIKPPVPPVSELPASQVALIP
jgi:hypothetical protein